ncbi:putative Zn finger-like uncharacterized protein [Trinickia symbiotica]|uniref:DUF3426 domain-containing protein n=1 Tax=Trinickia symbiotica TaxID=863227 RepID=A0A2N7WZ33_9BURK|nr:DUF3426 domain-containing protein [Trinickia symbiotica]PMS34582.1 DUF3426 domain-containing protein [Trinickia symbiotica]PPK43076.1 putative Zn finger-like uncharacterized protein [Trinickia symbiotica]
MVLATRCPHCETVFRVQDAQLARTRGRVRCGHCNEVFDALQNLLDPSAASTIDFGARDQGRQQQASSAAPTASQAAPLDRINGAPRAFTAQPAEREARDEATAEQAAPTVQPPPSTFADIVADELREPTLASPLVAEPTAKAPPAPSGPEAPQTLRTPKEPAVSTEPNQARAPSAMGTPAHAERMQAAAGAAANPAAPTAAVSAAAAASPAPAEREPAASESDSHSKPGDERDEEPKLSLGDAPAATWRTEREAREPRFSVPPAEPLMPPPASARPAGVPPLAAQAEERSRPFEVTREPRAGAPRYGWLRAVGAFLSILLAVLLVAQLTWWRRETVMVYWPSSQSLFAEVCTYLGCQISPPRDIDGLQVEASDLRQIDGPHRLELRVPLRNRYNIALAYPAIELTLFDEKNEIAIRRVLWPQDYAPPGTPIAAGLPPHTTQTMIVRLDSGNAVATNFRVQIFYP